MLQEADKSLPSGISNQLWQSNDHLSSYAAQFFNSKLPAQVVVAAAAVRLDTAVAHPGTAAILPVVEAVAGARAAPAVLGVEDPV